MGKGFKDGGKGEGLRVGKNVKGVGLEVGNSRKGGKGRRGEG